MSERKHTMKFSSLKTVLVIVAMCAALGAGYLLYGAMTDPIPFDSGEWKSARAAGDYTRCERMALSLISKLQNQNLSINEIITQFGKPDATDGRGYFYKLHAAKFDFFPDEHWLLVSLNPNADPGEKQTVYAAKSHHPNIPSGRTSP